MSVLFVAGAGTDIGKTYVSCALVRQWRMSGCTVRALKPVASGMPALGDPGFQDSDTARLLAAQNLPRNETTVAACTPWRFEAPLSPDMAAAVEGRFLPLADIVAWTQSIVREVPADDLVLIEGVGGVMSPIASDGLNIDLIAALARPAILVGGTYLGAISHTLTAITALRAHSIELWGLVINETAGSSVDFAATVGSLVRFAPHVRVMTLRYGQQTIPELPDLPPVP